MIARRRLASLVPLGLVPLAFACSLDSPSTDAFRSAAPAEVDAGADSSSSSKAPTTGTTGRGGPKDDPATCVWEGPPSIDLETLPRCGPKASCLPSAIIPEEARVILGECEGGGATCVPDIFVEKNGKFVLTTCRSLYGAEGRCLTTAIPQVKEVEATVPQSTCEEGHRCLPCFNPFDGTDTRLCGQSCDKPAEPAKVAPRCCAKEGKERGVCVPKDLLGQDQAGLASGLIEEGDCVKAEPSAYVCVPQEFVQLQKPATCTASIPLEGPYQGVCVSDCFAQSPVTAILRRGDCADPLSKCVPCTNPLDGAPTGLPGCPGRDGGT